ADYDGEVHTYVGDEVIVTWPLSGDPERNARSLRCFFAVEERMIELAPSYAREFGVVPRFRAGIHAGPVVVSECGVTKRQIAYFGDTMNVAARLCEHCKVAGETLVASADVLRSAVVPHGLSVGRHAGLMLRGRRALRLRRTRYIATSPLELAAGACTGPRPDKRGFSSPTSCSTIGTIWAGTERWPTTPTISSSIPRLGSSRIFASPTPSTRRSRAYGPRPCGTPWRSRV